VASVETETAVGTIAAAEAVVDYLTRGNQKTRTDDE